MMLLVWILLIGTNSIANAFYTYQIPTTTTILCPVSRLYGINEWRDKFSSTTSSTTTSTNNNNSSTIPDYTLPLLLLPFKPTQILLPGQTTKLQFKQGKYIDIIDEALTSYESVVGLSILDDDGLLPFVILCEINEESFVMNSVGYRGFSSVEVDVCAVGRAYRVTTNTNDLEDEKKHQEEEARTFIIRDDTVSGVSKNISFPIRKQPTKTAQDDIHLGLVHEMYDDILNDDEFDIANEYLGILGISSNDDGQQEVQQPPLDDRILHQQQLYTDAYTLMLEQQTSLQQSNTSKEQQLLHSKLVAASWGALAAATNTVRGRSNIRSSSSTIITKAIETRSIVERLKLGLAAILDSQMPSGREDRSDIVGVPKENTFQ